MKVNRKLLLTYHLIVFHVLAFPFITPQEEITYILEKNTSLDENTRHFLSLLLQVLKSKKFPEYEFLKFVELEKSVGKFVGIKKKVSYMMNIELSHINSKELCDPKYNSFFKVASQREKGYFQDRLSPIKILIDDSIIKRVCIFEEESVFKADMPLFDLRRLSIVQTTKLFVQFLVNVVQAFDQLIYKFKCYHGDIRPNNIGYIREGSTIIPRIIVSKKSFNPRVSRFHCLSLLYEGKFRPPELDWMNKYNDNDKFEDIIEFKNYRLSGHFLEESFALGMTLKKMIEINSHSILTSSYIIILIEEIANELSRPNIKDRMKIKDARIQIEEAGFGKQQLISY